ncbi:MAG: pirin family protein [Bacteroidota bacterium]
MISTLRGAVVPRTWASWSHPHRGFSPVTFIYKGSVHHRDSIGNDSVVGAGGTQWMHAGRGIIHSERPSKELASQGGPNEFVQVWINTPAAHKMDAPHYQAMPSTETPRVELDKANVAVVAGEFAGVTGIARTFTPQTLLRFDLEAGADLSFPIPASYNCLIYLLDGGMQVNGRAVTGREMVQFAPEGTDIRLVAEQPTRALLLSGEPIGEPVVSYGPFVMNRKSELMTAIQDSQTGKMGRLVEKF